MSWMSSYVRSRFIIWRVPVTAELVAERSVPPFRRSSLRHKKAQDGVKSHSVVHIGYNQAPSEGIIWMTGLDEGHDSVRSRDLLLNAWIS